MQSDVVCPKEQNEKKFWNDNLKETKWLAEEYKEIFQPNIKDSQSQWDIQQRS